MDKQELEKEVFNQVFIFSVINLSFIVILLILSEI